MNDHPNFSTNVELVALDEEFNLAWAAERDVLATAPDTPEGEALISTAWDTTHAVAQKIEKIPASIGGIKLKAQALRWALGADLRDVDSLDEDLNADERLTASLVRDIAEL